MTVIQIITGAGLVCIIPVNGHVATVQVVHALVLVRRPYQFLDTVTAANIGYKVEHCGIRFIVHRIRVFGIACDLDGDSAVVIRRT